MGKTMILLVVGCLLVLLGALLPLNAALTLLHRVVCVVLLVLLAGVVWSTAEERRSRVATVRWKGADLTFASLPPRFAFLLEEDPLRVVVGGADDLGYSLEVVVSGPHVEGRLGGSGGVVVARRGAVGDPLTFEASALRETGGPAAPGSLVVRVVEQ